MVAVGCLVGNSCEILPGVVTGGFCIKYVSRYWELKLRNEDVVQEGVTKGVHGKGESRL